MVELLESVASWRSLLFVVAVFGFAPGFVLRLLVKIYPREDPRRAELVAQLYTLGRLERPFFVAEQLETVLFDGIPSRRHARRAPKSDASPEIDLTDRSGLIGAIWDRNDWLHPLIRSARVTIDSVSVARGVGGVAFEYWEPLGIPVIRRYLGLQEESLGHDVRLRQLFVIDGGEVDIRALRDTWDGYAEHGIEVRILEASALSRLPLFEFVVFDNVVAFENRPEVSLVTSDDVRQHVSTFGEAWALAVPLT